MGIAVVRVDAINELQQEFVERAHKMIWCSFTTVDEQGKPHSRIVHPVWEGEIGWLTTRRQSPKTKHLASNPHVSLAYIADIANPVYAECIAEWVDDPAEKQRVWDFIRDTPTPLGFDPGPMYGAVDDPGFGLLKLIPTRIQIDTIPAQRRIWKR